MKRGFIIGVILIVLVIVFLIIRIDFTGKVIKSSETQKSITKTYIYAGNLLASKTSDSSDTTYYIQDHLGSNRKVIDGEVQENEFYAFGEEKLLTGNFNNNYKYTGKPLDDETGLYYYGARYYQPELGRFIQADVLRGSLVDPLSLNRYAYVSNNPLKYVDPSGNQGMGGRETQYMMQHDEELRKQRSAAIKDAAEQGHPTAALIAVGGMGGLTVGAAIVSVAPTLIAAVLGNPVTTSTIGITALEMANPNINPMSPISSGLKGSDLKKLNEIEEVAKETKKIIGDVIGGVGTCKEQAYNSGMKLTKMGYKTSVTKFFMKIADETSSSGKKPIGHAVLTVSIRGEKFHLDQGGITTTKQIDNFYKKTFGKSPKIETVPFNKFAKELEKLKEAQSKRNY